jgi:hypothetical protein
MRGARKLVFQMKRLVPTAAENEANKLADRAERMAYNYDFGFEAEENGSDAEKDENDELFPVASPEVIRMTGYRRGLTHQQAKRGNSQENAISIRKSKKRAKTADSSNDFEEDFTLHRNLSRTNSESQYLSKNKKVQKVAESDQFVSCVQEGYNEYEFVINLSFEYAKNIFIDFTSLSGSKIFEGRYGSLRQENSRRNMKHMKNNTSADMSKTSRVGPNFQADIPDCEVSTLRDHDSELSTGLVWSGEDLGSIVDSTLRELRRTNLEPALLPGMTLVAYIAQADEYRLCTIIEVNEASSDCIVTVYDGDANITVAAEHCRVSSLAYEALIHDVVFQHRNTLTDPIQLETKALISHLKSQGSVSGFNDLGLVMESKLQIDPELRALVSAESNIYKSWSYDEVDTFCDGVKR